MLNFYLISIGICLLVTLTSTKVFQKLNLVDRPDGKRKIHKGDIALSGGISLFLSISVLLYLFHDFESLDSFQKNFSIIWTVSVIILLMGLVDDVSPLTPFSRLAIQIFASWLVIIFSDVYLRDLGNIFGIGNLYLGEVGLPITIFMIVGICNAFNMIDGMDGFVGFVVLISSITLGIMFSDLHFNHLIHIAPIAISVFLFFNLGLLGKKFKIFLGDSGSMWLGFIVGWYLVLLTQGDSSSIEPVTALWLVMLPLVDALSTFLNRLIQKKSMFLGDRTHFHHLLLDAGLVKWKVLVILILFSSASCGVALISWIYDTEEHYQFYGFLTIWALYALFLKYPFLKIKQKS